MKTTENNKLIAEFMGMELGDDKTMYYDDVENLHPPTAVDKLKYHSSWDWLMPVVEKCYQCDYEEGGDMHMRMNDAIMTINIEEVYQAVIEFIKWYNENK